MDKKFLDRKFVMIWWASYYACERVEFLKKKGLIWLNGSGTQGRKANTTGVTWNGTGHTFVRMTDVML